ncbi:hypothetical protein GUITHDRAFT_135915 [Guillardia theta CCMP2712]|uniref:SHOCT domain-containing protein n=1 Tax=Guillardia theta (strain CCMP2712) TaxID=905079 RepID=L1JNJ0_GUITC|nr:hypothetical protein GUITHDRAFT_135915 [Guillardia theta CCMP2712]EKX49755.1 hypothetical protein GUITHDRAFT_135915 [Guillardia theta CCMP2712]|eukprot:XP_005836735.1 hypothetical protein GUITHDRAFT_135915 [Guillardia theta CCMP2712]
MQGREPGEDGKRRGEGARKGGHVGARDGKRTEDMPVNEGLAAPLLHADEDEIAVEVNEGECMHCSNFCEALRAPTTHGAAAAPACCLCYDKSHQPSFHCDACKERNMYDIINSSLIERSLLESSHLSLQGSTGAALREEEEENERSQEISRTSHDVRGDWEEREGLVDGAWRGGAGKKFQISEPWGVWILADSVREECNVPPSDQEEDAGSNHLMTDEAQGNTAVAPVQETICKNSVHAETKRSCNVIWTINELCKLHDEGKLNDEEFAAAKQKILSGARTMDEVNDEHCSCECVVQ